jgi:hypothetical protein
VALVNEAQHCVPCVVSDAVGCPPGLIEPGITDEVFDTESVQGLASARVWTPPLQGRSDIREVCRTRVAGYNLEWAAERIAAVYEVVAAVSQRAGVAK